jgi:C-terminal processing protease CtpA/Prc
MMPVFASALQAIERTYVEEVPSDRLIYSALGGLMNTLDPHSHVMDPRTYAQTRQRQEGRYYGIGVSIQSVKGGVVIVNVTENAPAYTTGLKPWRGGECRITGIPSTTGPSYGLSSVDVARTSSGRAEGPEGSDLDRFLTRPRPGSW